MPTNFTNLTEEQLWDQIITQDWNLDHVRLLLDHPRTKYPGRPILFSATELFSTGTLTPHGEHFILSLGGIRQLVRRSQVTSVVPSTLAQLLKNLAPASDEPAANYLREQAQHYESLDDKLAYGFYALYFTPSGDFSSLVQFPELPVYKLALTCSCGPLYRDREYQLSWYQVRSIFNRTHVLVAGASVAGVAAQALLRDGRVGAISIGDPKAPNATNFNRTAFNVEDVALGQAKTYAFARQVHAQDPTQVLYLYHEGFNSENLVSALNPEEPILPVSLVVEAVDDINKKVDILSTVRTQCFPVIQIADVGSKVALTFNDCDDLAQGKSLLLGISDNKLETVLQQDFLSAAIYFFGIENVLGDEAGRFLKSHGNTPFTQAVPQMGGTAQVAAGLVAEEGLRYLLNQDGDAHFLYKRLVVDKKNHRFQALRRTSLKGRLLNLLLQIKKKR